MSTRQDMLRMNSCKAIPLMPAFRAYRQPETAAAQRLKWLTIRQTGLGASDMATVLGIEGAYSSRFALWHEKRPGASVVDHDPTEEQEWGLRLEDAIAEKFAEDHRRTLDVFRAPGAIWRHPEHEWLLCSPDRMTIDMASGALAPLELKKDQNSARWGDDPPEMYRVQLGIQCAVFGVAEGYLAALINSRYRSYRIGFDPIELDEWIAAGAEFVASLAGDPPELDEHPETTATLMRLYAGADLKAQRVLPEATIAEFEAAHAAERYAKERLDLAKNRIRDALGSAGVAVDATGRKVAYRSVYKVAGYTVAPHEKDQIKRAQR